MLEAPQKEPRVRTIAVLRANGLGDLIYALPALDALRRAYPDAEITWLGTDLHAAFFSNRPSPVDRVVVVPPCPGVRQDAPPCTERELDEFFSAMHEARFDLAVQLHGGGRYSNPFIRRLGARLTIGMRTPDAEPLDRSIPYIYFQPEVFRYLEVVALAGAIPGCAEPNVSVTEADLVEADQAVPDSGKPLAVLNPCATDSRRRWPAERFSEIGDALTRAGADVAVIGLAAGRKLVQGVLSAMAMPGIDLCNRLSLKGLIGVLARSRVLISNDSGPLHLASAVGAATVGIYWCGNLINACPLTRTRHRQAISWRLDCPVCSLNCLQERCPHTDSFVADISASEVLRSAMDLLVGSPYGPYERRSTGTAPQADSPGRSSEGAASTATKFRRNPALRPSRGDVQPVRRIGR